MLVDVNDLKTRQGVLQQLGCVEMIRIARPTRAVLQLPRRVALEHEMAASHQRGLNAREYALPALRRGELNKDAHHRVETFRFPLPVSYIGMDPLHFNASFRGELRRLIQRGRGDVDSGYATPGLSQPDAVAPLPAADIEHAHAVRKQ